MTSHVLSIIFATIVAAQAAYAGNGNDNQNSETWQLPGDILETSNQISFNQGAKDVWYFMKSNTLAQDESSYSLLTRYTTPCAEVGIAGLLCWYPSLPYDFSTEFFPWIGLNATEATLYPKTVTWPAQTLAMHPALDKLAIVVWRSPISKKINIQGSFTDLDSTCGNGVKWFINKGKDTLDSGVLNGDQASFNLTKVQIKQGEVLYFIVDPNNNDYVCDTTGLKVTINSKDS